MDKSTVTPYVAAKGADRFLDFVEAVFTGEKAARVRNPDGSVGHAEEGRGGRRSDHAGALRRPRRTRHAADPGIVRP
jgi:hypothetical protein